MFDAREVDLGIDSDNSEEMVLILADTPQELSFCRRENDCMIITMYGEDEFYTGEQCKLKLKLSKEQFSILLKTLNGMFL